MPGTVIEWIGSVQRNHGMGKKRAYIGSKNPCIPVGCIIEKPDTRHGVIQCVDDRMGFVVGMIRYRKRSGKKDDADV